MLGDYFPKAVFSVSRKRAEVSLKSSIAFLQMLPCFYKNRLSDIFGGFAMARLHKYITIERSEKRFIQFREGLLIALFGAS